MKHLSIFTLAALLTIWAGLVFGSGYHRTINNYYTENNFADFTDNYNPALAQLLAADAIHCSTSTRKNQMGVGAGYSEGKNGLAVGYCKTFLGETGTPWMVGFKAMGANDAKPRYNLGLNWTF